MTAAVVTKLWTVLGRYVVNAVLSRASVASTLTVAGMLASIRGYTSAVTERLNQRSTGTIRIVAGNKFTPRNLVFVAGNTSCGKYPLTNHGNKGNRNEYSLLMRDFDNY